MEQVQTMQSCNLSHSDVFSCGDSVWLQQRLVNLSELILSNALITSWCTVSSIVTALPVLETLDVSHNALQLADADRDESQSVLSSSLAQIILNSTVRIPVLHFMFLVVIYRGRGYLGPTLSSCL
jgi:hypothetical protein